MIDSKQKLVIYSDELGNTKLSVRLQDGNILLSQVPIVELFKIKKYQFVYKKIVSKLNCQGIFDSSK